MLRFPMRMCARVCMCACVCLCVFCIFISLFCVRRVTEKSHSCRRFYVFFSPSLPSLFFPSSPPFLRLVGHVTPSPPPHPKKSSFYNGADRQAKDDWTPKTSSAAADLFPRSAAFPLPAPPCSSISLRTAAARLHCARPPGRLLCFSPTVPHHKRVRCFPSTHAPFSRLWPLRFYINHATKTTHWQMPPSAYAAAPNRKPHGADLTRFPFETPTRLDSKAPFCFCRAVDVLHAHPFLSSAPATGYGGGAAAAAAAPSAATSSADHGREAYVVACAYALLPLCSAQASANPLSSLAPHAFSSIVD